MHAVPRSARRRQLIRPGDPHHARQAAQVLQQGLETQLQLGRVAARIGNLHIQGEQSGGIEARRHPLQAQRALQQQAGHDEQDQ